MSVQQLETAVAELSSDELARFSQWFERYKSEQWDRQIEQDAKAGRLDAFLAEVDAEIEREGTQPL